MHVHTEEKARHTWEKIFTKHIADSGLMAKIHEKKLKGQKYKNNKMERSELTPNQESCTNRKTSRDAQGHKSWRVTLKQ